MARGNSVRGAYRLGALTGLVVSVALVVVLAGMTPPVPDGPAPQVEPAPAAARAPVAVAETPPAPV
ncbi:MAG: hypothetical protein ACK5MQ_18655, partial [Pikeienuella sp.]